MACRNRLNVYVSSILLKLVRIGTYIKLLWKYFWRFGTDNNFILRIAPLRDKTHDSYRNYFPPPCYGFPYGKTTQKIDDPPERYQKYGLFLWPDRLYQDISYFSILLFATLFPFISLIYCEVNNQKNYKFYIAIAILITIAALVKIIFITTANKTLPVLHKIWVLWPESHYSRFLTVPHVLDISHHDKDKEKNKYWHPDKSKIPLSHQPEFYEKGKNTLQEVILHLAIFDHLFYYKKYNKLIKNKNISMESKEINNKRQENKYKNSLKVKGWIYLFSPAIISYLLLLFSFFVSSLFYPSSKEEIEQIPVLLRYPFWYAPLIIIWFALTANMIFKQISFLENLLEDVRDGYYNAHLNLIPQQILKVVNNIPSDKQISKGIEQVESILRWTQTAALVTFFILLEIFSSGFS